MSKSILLISPDFFGYHIAIQEELERQGWIVTYLSDRPSSSTMMKVLIRKFRFLISRYLTRHYVRQLQKISVQFDSVIIVKGEGITKEVIREIRERYCLGAITLYLWDGVDNVPGGRSNIQEVDRVFTFDSKDAQKYGLQLLPLFFTKKTMPIASSAKWDVSFVGSIHGDRLKVIAKFRSKLSANIRGFYFVYFPSKILYLHRKFLDSSFCKFSSSELSLRPISRESAEEIFWQSNAILDVNHRKQSGLTMRTMEVLSLGKKLLTTNEYIVNYPFYDESQVFVIDRKNPTVSREFLESVVHSGFSEKMAPYEIGAWVRHLTGEWPSG